MESFSIFQIFEYVAQILKKISDREIGHEYSELLYLKLLLQSIFTLKQLWRIHRFKFWLFRFFEIYNLRNILSQALDFETITLIFAYFHHWKGVCFHPQMPLTVSYPKFLFLDIAEKCLVLYYKWTARSLVLRTY